MMHKPSFSWCVSKWSELSNVLVSPRSLQLQSQPPLLDTLHLSLLHLVFLYPPVLRWPFLLLLVQPPPKILTGSLQLIVASTVMATTTLLTVLSLAIQSRLLPIEPRHLRPHHRSMPSPHHSLAPPQHPSHLLILTCPHAPCSRIQAPPSPLSHLRWLTNSSLLALRVLLSPQLVWPLLMVPRLE